MTDSELLTHELSKVPEGMRYIDAPNWTEINRLLKALTPLIKLEDERREPVKARDIIPGWPRGKSTSRPRPIHAFWLLYRMLRCNANVLCQNHKLQASTDNGENGDEGTMVVVDCPNCGFRAYLHPQAWAEIINSQDGDAHPTKVEDF